VKSKTTRQFWKLFDQLPASVQAQAVVSYRLWQENTVYPSLHFKRIDPVEPIWSVRVGRQHRAVGLRDGDTMTWYWIGSHADYDKL
jgi:hypothetical protein